MVGMMNLFDEFNGKSYLVTGGSSGIGRDTAVLLSNLGANVAILGTNEASLQETVSLMAVTSHSKYYVFDLHNTDKIEMLMLQIYEDYGVLSGIVHSAGISPIKPFRNLKSSDYDRVMRVNFYSFLELVRVFVYKKISDGGVIVGISSTASSMGEKGQTIYSASKAAMDGSIKTIAQEISPRGYRINTLRPGLITTNMTEMFSEKNPEFMATQTTKQLLGLGEVRDVANFAIFLLSSMSKFCTGRSYYVDGGRIV